MANELKGKISLDVSGFVSALQTVGTKLKEFATASAKAIQLTVKADTKEATESLKTFQDVANKPIELPPIQAPDVPDTFNITEQLKSAKEEASKLQTELAQVIAQGGKGSAFYDAIANKLKIATTEADRLEAAIKEAGDASRTVKLTPSDAFNNSLKSAKDQAAQLQTEVAQIAVTQGKGSAAYAEAVKKLKDATTEADKLDEALKDAAEQSRDIEPPKGVFAGLTDQFRAAKDQASAGGGIFGDIAGKIGALVSPLGAATAAVGLLTAGLGASFSIGMEFETNLKSVQAVTGVAGAALDDIGNRARNLATTFGGSASEQLGVFQVTLSKIGPQLAQDAGALTTFAENVNVLSKTDSALGAAGAVDALTGAMLQFGVDVNNSNEVAKESTRFINVLAASAAVGSASVSDVAAAVAVAGGPAKNANVSFEELNASLQVLAAKSISAGPAGTALTAVINKLQAASGPAADQLIAMGTSSAELGKLLTTKGIGAAMDKLGESMKSLGTDAEKNSFLVGLFGETGLNAASALLKGGDMLKDFTAKVTGTKDAFVQAEVNMSTLSERMSRAMASFQDIGITVYQAILPIINQVLNFFDKLYQNIAPVLNTIKNQIGAAFSNAYAVIQPILAGIVALIAGSFIKSITVTIGILSAFASFISTFTQRVREAVEPIFTKIGQLFGSAGSSALTLENVLKGVGKTIEVFAGILGELGGFIAEVLVIPFQLLAGVIGNIVEFFQSFTSSAQTAKNEVKGTGEQAQKAASLFEILGNAILKIPAFLAGLRAAFVAIKEVIFEFGEAISNTFNKGIGATFDKIYNIFAAAGSKTGKAFDDGWNKTLKAGEDKKVKDAEESGKALGNALGGGVVQGYEYWVGQLQKLQESIATMTAEEQTAAVNTFKDQLKNAAELGNITDPQQVELRNKAAKLIEKEKKDSKDKNKEILDDLKKQYEQSKAANDLELSLFEKKINDQVELDKRQKMSDEEARLLAEKKLSISEKNLALYERIFKVALDTAGMPVVAIPKLEEDGKNTVKKDYLAFLKDLSNQRIQLNKIEFDAEGLKAELDRIIGSIDIGKGVTQDLNVDLFSTPIDVEVAFSVKTGEGLSKTDLFFINAENKVKALNEFILKSEEKLQTSKDDVANKALKTQIERAKEEVKKSEKAISDERTKVQESEQLLRQTIIGDVAEKEYLEKRAALQKEFAEVINKTRAEGTERLIIQQEFLDRETQLTEEYNKRRAQGFSAGMNKAIAGLSDALSSVFAKPYTFKVNADEAEKAAKQIADLRQEQEKLFSQVKEGTLSFEEYQNKYAQLSTQITDLEKVTKGVDWSTIFSEFKTRAAETFTALSETLNKSFEKTIQQKTEYESQIQKLNTRLNTITDKSSKEYKLLSKEREKIEEDSAKSTDTTYGLMAASVIGSTGKMVAEGKPLFQALGASAFDALQMMVPIWSAQILGNSLSTPASVLSGGAAGIAEWALLTGLIQAAVSAARAVLGFKEGGYTGDGKRDDVKGVVHAGEVVFEAPIVKGQKESILALRALMQKGVSAKNLLDVYTTPAKALEIASSRYALDHPELKYKKEHQDVVQLFYRITDQTSKLPLLNNQQSSNELAMLRRELVALRGDVQGLRTSISRKVALDVGVKVEDNRSKVDVQRAAIRGQIKGENRTWL